MSELTKPTLEDLFHQLIDANEQSGWINPELRISSFEPSEFFRVTMDDFKVIKPAEAVEVYRIEKEGGTNKIKLFCYRKNHLKY